MAAADFETIDEYIASFPPDVQSALQTVRQTVREVVPAAQEKISYKMPAFTLDGVLVYFAAWRDHIGFYGHAGSSEGFAAELASYANEKGSLLFSLDRPLPLPLIRDVVQRSVERNQRRADERRARNRSRRAEAKQQTATEPQESV